MKTTDFQKSRIKWVTINEKSLGSFQIESILELQKDKDSPRDIFGLGASVLAGNMYADTDLVQIPPYSFQIAGNSHSHKIFRTYSNHDTKTENAIKDTVRLNKKVFKLFRLELVNKSVKKLERFKDIEKTVLKGGNIIGALSVRPNNGSIINISFPVKHINLLSSQKKWQLETGPILYLNPDMLLQTQNITSLLIPCFIHANSFSNVDITIDFPFVRRSHEQGLVDVANVTCDLCFLADV